MISLTFLFFINTDWANTGQVAHALSIGPSRLFNGCDYLKQGWANTQKEVVKEKRDNGFFAHLDGKTVDVRNGNDVFHTLQIQDLKDLVLNTTFKTEQMV